MWLALTVTAALAQDVRFDGQVFRPSSDSVRTIWTEDTHTAPDGYATARAYLQYANSPVRWRGADGETDRLVSDLLAIDVLGAVRWRTVRLGVHAPLYLATVGALADAEPGLGDLAIDLKGTLIERDEFPFGVAVMGRLALPTASVDVPLGAGSTGWELLLIADREMGSFTVAANLGTRDVPRAEFQDLVWNDQVFARVGGGWQWTEDLGGSVELAGQTNWSSGQNPAGTAAELMAGGWLWVADGIIARSGLSFGLTRSPGAPIARLLAGVSWEPDPTPDRDADGIVNRYDQCPEDPEDPDGYEDDDGCGDPSFTAALNLTGRDSEPVDGEIVLTGPDHVTLAAGEHYVVLHPGTYTVTSEIDGYHPLSTTIEVPRRQGEQFTLSLLADDGTVRVWAVDAGGKPVPAGLTISGGLHGPADGSSYVVAPGEHALVVTADGYLAAATSVFVRPGEVRETSVVMTPEPRAVDPSAEARLTPP